MVIVILALIIGNGIGATNIAIPQAQAATEPDLTITGITWNPEQPKTGETLVLSVSIKNLGASATGECILVYTLDGNVLTSATIAPLNAGASVTHSYNWKSEPGKHTLAAAIDANGAVTESDESNNSAVVSFPVLAADLIVKAIEWSPQSPSIGDKVTFTVTIENIGDDASAWSWAEFLIDGSPRGQVEIGRVSPGAAVTANFYWIAREGEFTITAVADPSAKTFESNETNNEKTVKYGTAIADLIVDSITWTPEQIFEDCVATFSVNIKNAGTGKSNSGWLAYFIDGKTGTRLFCEQLEPGATMTRTFMGHMSWGNHSVRAIVDAENSTAEINENNNEKEAHLTTFLPDFALFLAPDDYLNADVGETITIRFVVHNIGEAPTKPSKITYYLDGKASGEGAIAAIEPQASVMAECKYTMKANPVKLKAAVDVANLISEKDENNNTQEIVLERDQGVDLVVSAISASPVQPATGDTVEFGVTVKNVGIEQAVSSMVALYVDGIELNKVQIKALNRGESAVAAFTWKAVSGTHTIRTSADAHSWVDETREDNNERTASISTKAPDFAFATVTTSPENPSPGEQVNFAVTLQNRGSLPAVMSSIQSLADGAVTGLDSVRALAPGETCVFNFAWVMQSGPHKISFRVDTEEKVTELDETNNTFVVNFPLTADIPSDTPASPGDGGTGQTLSGSPVSENNDPNTVQPQNSSSGTPVPTGTPATAQGNDPNLSSAKTAPAPEKIDKSGLFSAKFLIEAAGRHAWWIGIILVAILMLIFRFGKHSNSD